MTTTTERAVAAPPWRFFATEVRRVERLSPHFLRVTLTGDDLDRFADNGFDQRIKLIPPLPDSGHAHLPTGADWFARWRELPDDRRNPIRTYTVRAVRPHLREVDIDMVLHGETGENSHSGQSAETGGTAANGPAGRWAAAARPGATAYLLGPNAEHDGVHGGVDFHPPAHAERLLIGGDETAVPAIASILDRLDAGAAGEVLLEVPSAADFLTLRAPEGIRITWLARGSRAYGDMLVPALHAATRRILGDRPAGPPAALEDIDIDQDILWEVPDEAEAPGGVDAGRCYAWLAGEAGVIRTLRRHLVAECGIDRRSVAFMGYWRLGRSEDA